MNLCFSNLLSAVVVKSISIVHNAYAGDRLRLNSLWDYFFYRQASNSNQSLFLLISFTGLSIDNFQFTFIFAWHWLVSQIFFYGSTFLLLPFTTFVHRWQHDPLICRYQMYLTCEFVPNQNRSSWKKNCRRRRWRSENFPILWFWLEAKPLIKFSIPKIVCHSNAGVAGALKWSISKNKRRKCDWYMNVLL